MKNLSVRVKMILLALITLVGTLAIVFLAETNISEMEKDSEMVLRASIESDYDENIKNQVDCAISLLNRYTRAMREESILLTRQRRWVRAFFVI